MKIANSLIVLSLLLAPISTLSATVTKTTTMLSSSQNPSVYGQPVSLTAVVSSSLGAPPDGDTVTFYQGANVIGTAPLGSGSAQLTVSTLSGGTTDNVKAIYAGDSSFGKSTSNTVAQQVTQATTTTSLNSSQNPSAAGQPVTFTAVVAPEYGGTPTGTVSFYNGNTKLGSGALSGGVASYVATKLALGTDTITAVYNGSIACGSSSSNPLSQVMASSTTIDTTMTWGGVTRYYEVYLPASMSANPPMLFMLHGTRTDDSFDPEAVISLMWGWQGLADQYGFILVKPASTYNYSTHQWNWNAYFMDAAFQGTPPDDSGFLRQLIVNLTAQYNVNPAQVYVAGFSSGAQMAERVGVEISDLVAAISPASGQMVGQQVPPPVLPGNAVAPIAVQEWHGTADNNLWPCGYGTTKYSGVTYTLDTVDDTFNYWVQQNGCSTLQTTQPLCSGSTPNYQNDAPTPGLPGMTGNIATGCTNNTQVQFIWEPNIAHSFQQQYNVQRWQFFVANPMPAERVRR